MEAAREEVKKPFPQAAELEEQSARLAELNALLNMDERGGNDAVGLDALSETGEEEPTVQGQQTHDVARKPADPDRTVKSGSVLARLHEKRATQKEAQGAKTAPKKTQAQEL